MKNAIALGTFDGIHKGHMAVLSMPDGYKKIAVTFDLPPKSFGSGIKLLMTPEGKKEKLKEMGINPNTLDFVKVKDIPAKDFLESLVKTYSPAYISCGYDYRFGKNGEGNAELLTDFCQDHKIRLNVVSPVLYENEPVSSTRIRKLLSEGKIEKANEMLSVPFSFKEKVILGDQRGRTLGFPTVNQLYPVMITPLRYGVYQTNVYVDGKKYCGITDIGQRPTFPVEQTVCETHILDFSGDLYGKPVTVEPVRFIRSEMKFSSSEELKNQIEKDILIIKE